MKCRFVYKNGKQFDSELALDEFLSNSLKYDKEITDVVFESDTKRKAKKAIIERRARDAKSIMSGHDYIRIETDIYEDYDLLDYFPKGHIPVTRGLSEYIDENGDILFPIFISENYWKNHIENDWNHIDYWNGTRKPDAKGELSIASQNEINAVFGEGVRAEDITTLPTPEQIEKGKNLISTSWPLQGFMGTGIHMIYETYWNCINSHIKDDNEIINKINEYLESKTLIKGKAEQDPKYSIFKGIKFSEIISPSVISTTLEACKKLHKELITRLSVNENGDDLTFMPEISAITSINDFKGDQSITNLVGNFDLLVLDSNDNIHIIDYKTSPKNYTDYNSAKKRTFYYQLATYRRMVERMGFVLKGGSKVFVVPTRFNNFVLHPIDLENDDIKSLLTFDSVSLEGQILEELDITSSNIQSNVDKLLPLNNREVASDGDILQAVEDFTKYKFSTFAEQNKVTIETTRDLLISKRADKINKSSQKFIYTFNGKLYKKDTFEELVDEVYHARLNLDANKNYIKTQTQAIKAALQDAINHPEKKIELTASPKLETLLNNYANSDYEILDNYSEALDSLGIIMIRNIVSRKVDIIMWDNSPHALEEQVKLLGNRETLTGCFESDIIAKNKPNELVLKSTHGNIKLMQIMATINEIPEVFADSGINSINVFNVPNDQGITASNEELLYNFKELCKLDKEHIIQDNLTSKTSSDDYRGTSDKVRFASYLGKIKLKIFEICTNPPNNRFASLQSALSDFDKLPIGNIVQVRNELVSLANKISEKFNLTYDTKSENLNTDGKQEAYKLLVDIHTAIGEIDGINFRQQLSDHSKYLNAAGIKEAFTKGWSGNSLDNPGMLDSDLLNIIGKQLNIGYQNVRDETLLISKKLFELGEKLRRDKGFGYLKSRTFGNEASLFTNMYDDTYTDDLVFKNPFDDTTMLDSEKEYLKYCLLQINNRRYGIQTLEELENKLNSADFIKYLRVPLMRGSGSSKIANKGLMYALKDSFSKLIPNKENLREVFHDFLLDDETIENFGDETTKRRLAKSKDRSKELWEMSSHFDVYESEEARKIALTEPTTPELKKMGARGIDFWERNLEVLTTAHSFSYIMKENINKIFPVLKAVAYQLEYQGFILNKHFAEDIEYLHNFITAKVLNMSIQDPKWETLSHVSGTLMKGASKLALAFNPRQLYQLLDGIWKDFMLVIKKPDGTEAFSAKNFKDSFFWVYKELAHHSNTKSLARTLNELYGINDMDMNVFNQKILPNQFGLFNWNNLAFHFASRPDFYNRMTIFGAHMRADGCFEAHDSQGNYDWTKDKRYDVFAKYAGKEDQVPQNLKEIFNKQKAHYLTTARQFQNENAKYMNSKGELVDFEVNINNPIPLPRAYTVKEAESIKSMADMVYGYYSHEKKSLIQSTTAGALLMQMNTFWSSKKNQFMAPGGIRMTGKWVHYQENGDLYYVDEQGNPTKEVTDTPYMVWQGQYQEGIFVTLFSMIGEMVKTKDVLGTFKNYWNNENENLKTAYRSNLGQIFYDLLMLLLLGVLVAPALENAAKDYTKEVGNENLSDAIVNNIMLNGVAMLKTSTDDFFFMNTIFGRGIQWTPFAITTTVNTVKRIGSCISGNTDFYDTGVKLSAATRTRESLFDNIKINYIGRPIGDNGKSDE